MERRFLAAFCIAVVVVLQFGFWSDNAAVGSWGRFVDDDCKGLYPTPYFFADGPARYWYTNSGGSNNCHMWTTTIDYSLAPVNLAWWYTDPQDSSGYGNAQMDSVGSDNSCGYAYYGLMASGDTGPTSWYYISLAAGSRFIFTNTFFTPYLGAKVKLPDSQPCAVNSSIQADYVSWSMP